MRKHLSVLMLYITNTIYKLILIIVAMAAIEFAGFKLFGPNLSQILGLKISSGFFSIIFAAACLGLILVCIQPSEKNSKYGYTLMRLQVSERSVFLWHSLSNVLSFLILWGAQIIMIFVLCKLHAGSDTYAEGPQGILVNFYRIDFLHSLFPLDETSLWIRNLMYAISAGTSCAYTQLAVRHNKKPVCAVMALLYSLITFSVTVGSGVPGGLLTAFFQLVLTGSCIALAISAAHDGKRYADE